MINVSVNLKIERLDNGLLATGSLIPGHDDIRCYYGNANELVEAATAILKEQIRNSRQFEGKHDFTLKIEAHNEGDHV